MIKKMANTLPEGDISKNVEDCVSEETCSLDVGNNKENDIKNVDEAKAEENVSSEISSTELVQSAENEPKTVVENMQMNAVVASVEKKESNEDTNMSETATAPVLLNNEQTAKSTELIATTTTGTSSSTTIPTLTSGAVTTVRYTDLCKAQDNDLMQHIHCLAQQEQQRKNYEAQLKQLHTALSQKDNTITLYQRENAILEKEKEAFRKEKENATKDKEATVIKFAMKEKLLIDAKKAKDLVEKQLADAKKEIKNVSGRFQAVNEEKSRMTYIVDEKCNEVRKYQRDCERLKTEIGRIESQLKYHANKLKIETEAKAALEKKLQEERNAPNKIDEKATEKLKMEHDASILLLKHQITLKTEALEQQNRHNQKLNETVNSLEKQCSELKDENSELTTKLELLQNEHNKVQNCYSEEILNSAKLRGQLEDLQVLQTQNKLNEEKLSEYKEKVESLESTLEDKNQETEMLSQKKTELLSINKEISESIVLLQNEICLLKSKAQGFEAENNLLKQEKLKDDLKYAELKQQLNAECAEKKEERYLLAKHLSEKTKQYETTKEKLENILGDFEATKNKHSTIVRELQREIQKYKKSLEKPETLTVAYCNNCEQALNGFITAVPTECTKSHDHGQLARTHSRSSSHCSVNGSRRGSETSESETVGSCATTVQQEIQIGPSKKLLIDRILRLQQASARQNEKIDYLENRTVSLASELQKKTKVIQYYMLRDQTAGALTSSKSDQNKKELAKYGNGVMAAIYGGLKNENKSMTLDLSLEINKKLQTVLEDTLLKNITLKENLDVLGLEVENLTRKLRQIEVSK